MSREAKEPFSLHPAPESAILRGGTANRTAMPAARNRHNPTTPEASFPYTTKQFQKLLLDAVAAYWEGRAQQSGKQRKRGVADAGTRGEVTGGHQLDAFGEILTDLAKRAGYLDSEISFLPPLPVPGYYRPQKKWDFAVCRSGRLIAVAELKSQSGSFGNNCNNRTEEVIGLARDFWVAYREKVFGMVPAPWLGYFFLLEDSEKSRTPVRLHPSCLEPLEKFKHTSYQDRYRILCETLILERDFSATALVLSNRPSNKSRISVSEPFPALSFMAFCKSLYAHLLAHAHD